MGDHHLRADMPHPDVAGLLGQLSLHFLMIALNRVPALIGWNAAMSPLQCGGR